MSYWSKLFLLGCGASIMDVSCNYQHCTRCACRVGGAKVLLLGVLLWSIGTLAAPPLAHISLFALCASRVFVSIFTALQCSVFGRPGHLLAHGMLNCEATSLAHAWSGSTPLQLQYLLSSLHLGVSFFSCICCPEHMHRPTCKDLCRNEMQSLPDMHAITRCLLGTQVGLGEGLAPSSATNVMARLIPE